MHKMSVKCYGKSFFTPKIEVLAVSLPEDVNFCLPENCEDCILFSHHVYRGVAYLFDTFYKKGGRTLCLLLRSPLLDEGLPYHKHSSEHARLKKLVHQLILGKNSGCHFQVTLKKPSEDDFGLYMQFYGWSEMIKRRINDNHTLNQRCSTINIPAEI